MDAKTAEDKQEFLGLMAAIIEKETVMPRRDTVFEADSEKVAEYVSELTRDELLAM